MSLTIQSGGSLTIQGGGGGGGGGATVGTYANRPAAGNAGAIYICTDSPIAQWVDDGSAWRPMIQGQALGTQVPAASAFTAFSSGAFQDNNGTIDFSTTSNATGAPSGGVLSLSSSTAYVAGCFVGTAPKINYNTPGIFMRESSTGKAVAAILLNNVGDGNKTEIFMSRYTSTARTSYDSVMVPPVNGPVALRLRVSGANIFADYSSDFLSWTNFHSYALTTAFTTAPNQVGFGAQRDGNCSARLLSFKYGSL